jgi:hypothetical protein
MNHIKNKNSNRLTAARLDQLIFIYINSRVMKRLDKSQNDDSDDDDDDDEEQELVERAIATVVMGMQNLRIKDREEMVSLN